MKLILASNSPRRKELLQNAGYKFDIIPSTDEEVADKTLPPSEYTVCLAFQKALSVFNKHGNVVLGADTVVYFDGEILGKPSSKTDAELTLKKLSNKTHTVTTGYAIISENKTIKGSVTTKVTFNNLSQQVITDYLNSNLWQGKAGSYGIQDGFPLVKQIDGDYDNVVGLPINTINDILREYYEK
jgi:septum formation protein